MDFNQQAVYHSDNPSFKSDMPLARMSSCNTLALDDKLSQAVPTTVKNNSVIPVDMPEDVHPDFVHIINNHKQISSVGEKHNN